MIAGILKRKASDLDLRDFSEKSLQLLSRFGHVDHCNDYIDESACLTETTRQQIHSQAPDKQVSPIIEKDNIVIILWGLLTNREDLLNKLNLKEWPDCR